MKSFVYEEDRFSTSGSRPKSESRRKIVNLLALYPCFTWNGGSDVKEGLKVGRHSPTFPGFLVAANNSLNFGDVGSGRGGKHWDGISSVSSKGKKREGGGGGGGGTKDVTTLEGEEGGDSVKKIKKQVGKEVEYVENFYYSAAFSIQNVPVKKLSCFFSSLCTYST